MATRTISTRIAIEGEAEYRAALKNINSEYATLKSQLSLVQSQFRDNANSMEALTAKGDALNAMYKAQEEKVKTLKSALDNARSAQETHAQKSDDLRKQLAEANAEMENLKNSTGDTAKEQAELQEKIDKLNNALADSEAKEEAAARGVNNYQKQANLAEAQLNDLSREVEQNKQYLDEAKNSADGCATSIDKYGKEVKEAADDTGGANDSMSELSDLLASAGIIVGLKEVASAMLECAEAASEFGSSMAKIYTIADSGAVPIEAMRSELIAMSNELGKSVDDLAEASYQAISAGVDTANATSFVNQASKLAIAGFTDTTTAVDVLSTALNAYGLEADDVKRVSDVLVTTQKLGKTSVDELSQSMGKVIPTAAAFGVEIEQLGAAYASMTASGVKTSEATTYINQMLLELADTGSNVSKILQQETGQSFTDLMGSGASLGDIMEVLGSSVDGDATAFTNLWSSATAGTAALTIFNGGAEKFNDTLAQVSASAGATDTAFQTMADTSEQAHNRLITAAENLQIVVGDQLAPSYELLNQTGADLLSWASDFLQENDALIPILAAVAAGVGLYAAAVAGLAIIEKIKKKLGEFNTVLSDANPYMIAAAALATLVAAVVQYVASIEGVPEKTQDLVDRVQELADSYDDAVSKISDASTENRNYAKSIFDLASQQKRSASDQALLLEQINRLNEAVPDLNLAFDETTGTLNMTEEAVNSFLDSSDGYSEYEAAVRAYADANAASAEIAEELAAAEQKLAEIEASGSAVTNVTISGREIFSQEYLAAKENVEALTAAQEENNAVLEASKTAIDENTQETVNYAHAIEDNLKAELNDMQQRLIDVRQEYIKMRDEARASIDQQIGQWQKMDNQAKTSASTLNDALLSQIEYLDNYSANMDSLLGRNIDGVDELAETFSDGSTESAAALAGLAEASDEEIEEIIANMRKVDKGKDDFVDAIAAIHPELVEEMDEIKAAMADKKEEIRKAMDDPEGFASVGANDAEGYRQGLNSKMPAIMSTAAGLSAAAMNAMRRQSLQKSPSKAYEKIADNDALGYIRGWEKKRARLDEELRFQAETNLRVMQARMPTHEMVQAGLRAAEANQEAVIRSGLATGSGNMENLLSSVNAKLDKLLAGSDSTARYQIYFDDGTWAGRLAPAVNDAIGEISRSEGRGQ